MYARIATTDPDPDAPGRPSRRTQSQITERTQSDPLFSTKAKTKATPTDVGGACDPPSSPASGTPAPPQADETHIGHKPRVARSLLKTRINGQLVHQSRRTPVVIWSSRKATVSPRRPAIIDNPARNTDCRERPHKCAKSADGRRPCGRPSPQGRRSGRSFGMCGAFTGMVALFESGDLTGNNIPEGRQGQLYGVPYQLRGSVLVVNGGRCCRRRPCSSRRWPGVGFSSHPGDDGTPPK